MTVNYLPLSAPSNTKYPGVTPELLGAIAARYSRSNEGLDAILEKVDFNNPEKSINTIFKYIDYGHQSIADNVPVSLFMDDISVFLAYWLWSECNVVAGQESSTRYIKMSVDGLMDPKDLGIIGIDDWHSRMQKAFECYEQALDFWNAYAAKHPEVMRIPASLLNDTSEASIKKVERMRRNYAFDRARVYLPVAAKTNVTMTMSAREWVKLIKKLLSHVIPEFTMLGKQLKHELSVASPNMVRHAKENEADKYNGESLLLHWSQKASVVLENIHAKKHEWLNRKSETKVNFLIPDLGITWLPYYNNPLDDLTYRNNRYCTVGAHLGNTPMIYSVENIGMAEIRDLNRHRPGRKYCELVPLGFYNASDQIFHKDIKNTLPTNIGHETLLQALESLEEENPSYIYDTLLGHQYVFTHQTNLDNFIYTTELRTGVGSHYKYAEHMRDGLQHVYRAFPDLEGVIIEGSAEPE